MRIILTFGGHFERFIETLEESVIRKIDYGLALLARQERLSSKYVKYLEDGIFELRIQWGNSIYRVFFIFDIGNVVVLFNGFQKKTEQTPRAEIERAKKIKKQYYEAKNGQ